MAINIDNRVIHRFIKDISDYEIGGEFYSQIIPLDTQAYANYPGIENDKLCYVIGDGEHTYTELRDGKGNESVYKEYLVLTESDLDNISVDLENKVDKTSESLKIYGTDNDGNQILYDFDDFGKVDDVKIGTISAVVNKVANLGTMAGENTSDYYTKLNVDNNFASKSIETAIAAHIANKNNPHGVTKEQIGLGNVDNTSDLNKPINNATQEALNGKQNNLTDTQLNAVNSGITSNIVAQIGINTQDILDINEKIPEQASSLNQLADKEFVNSSIATNTANFIGTFGSITELNEYSGDVTNNDYAFIINSVVTNNGNDWNTFNELDSYDKLLLTNFDYAWVINDLKFDLYRFDIVEQEWILKVSNTDKQDVTLNTAYNRYKASIENNIIIWDYEYTLNNSSFTASQWAAINSGATQTNIEQITTNTNSINTINTSSPMVSGITSTKVSNYDSHIADTTIHVTSSDKQTWNAKQDTLTAGTNIQINGNVISATDTTYSAGVGISIANGVISNTKADTFAQFPNTWTTNGTVAQLMADITNDNTATKGMAYLGEVTCSDLPFNGNAEMMIYIMDNADGLQGKVIYAVLNSSNVSPYHWEMTYWNGQGTWRSFIPTSEIDSVPTASSTNVITSGGVYTALGNKQDILTSSNAGTGISITTQQGLGVIISNTQPEPEGFTASEVQTIWDSVDNE